MEVATIVGAVRQWTALNNGWSITHAITTSSGRSHSGGLGTFSRHGMRKHQSFGRGRCKQILRRWRNSPWAFCRSMLRWNIVTTIIVKAKTLASDFLFFTPTDWAAHMFQVDHRRIRRHGRLRISRFIVKDDSWFYNVICLWLYFLNDNLCHFIFKIVGNGFIEVCSHEDINNLFDFFQRHVCSDILKIVSMLTSQEHLRDHFGRHGILKCIDGSTFCHLDGISWFILVIEFFVGFFLVLIFSIFLFLSHVHGIVR
mmetsp:Transcript_25325/g.44452  ORF Transcript_25325/g.44452 Transcript_25325/m.44452 type:complete len:256 (-) Transcript_25325:206-973(-)